MRRPVVICRYDSRRKCGRGMAANLGCDSAAGSEALTSWICFVPGPVQPSHSHPRRCKARSLLLEASY